MGNWNHDVQWKRIKYAQNQRKEFRSVLMLSFLNVSLLEALSRTNMALHSDCQGAVEQADKGFDEHLRILLSGQHCNCQQLYVMLVAAVNKVSAVTSESLLVKSLGPDWQTVTEGVLSNPRQPARDMAESGLASHAVVPSPCSGLAPPA